MAVTEREQRDIQPYLDELTGHAFFQYRVSVAGVHLDFGLATCPELTVEKPLTITRDGAKRTDEPHSHFVLLTLRDLLEQTVSDARLAEDGSLRITFAHGDSIHIRSADTHEAWQFSDNRRLLVVSSAGGGIAYWLPTVAVPHEP